MNINKITLIISLSFAFALASFAGGEGWLNDFDEAATQAAAEGKTIMLEFHGSDWCPPCIKLNNEILSTDKFKSYAKENLVLVDLDFPRKTELPAEQAAHNSALARKYGIKGFPTVVLVKPDGTVIDSTVGYPRGGYEGFMTFLKENVE